VRTAVALLVIVAFISGFPVLRADPPAPIGCRTVQLGYYAFDSVAFYAEATIEQSSPGSCFVVCGWGRGALGLQELASGRRLVLFSVWDVTSAEAASRQAPALQAASGVPVNGPDGEGQAFLEYDWKTGVTYRFCVSALPSGRSTVFSGWFFHPEKQSWIRLMSYSAATPTPERLYRLASLVEDCRRNRESLRHARSMRVRNLWSLDDTGTWSAISAARFLMDETFIDGPMSFDATTHESQTFRLATGGDTTNTGARPRERLLIECPPSEPPDWKSPG
jgi:hypothetical protein